MNAKTESILIARSNMAQSFLNYIVEPLDELKKPFSKYGVSKFDCLQLWLALINSFDRELAERGIKLPSIVDQVEMLSENM